MIKKCLLFLLVSTGCFVQAQELFLLTGKNFTTYNYKNSQGVTNSNIRSAEGAAYQLGMDFKFSKTADSDKLTYAVSVVYNQFNAVGATSTDNYSWKTNYLGVQNALNFTFIEITNSFKVKTKIGIAASTIINGEQFINNTKYDISKNEEFSGIVLQPNISIDFQYTITQNIKISGGYEFSKVFNTSNSSAEELSFTNNQIHFGLHFPLN
jgi:hypothetical protein